MKLSVTPEATTEFIPVFTVQEHKSTFEAIGVFEFTTPIIVISGVVDQVDPLYVVVIRVLITTFEDELEEQEPFETVKV